MIPATFSQSVQTHETAIKAYQRVRERPGVTAAQLAAAKKEYEQACLAFEADYKLRFPEIEREIAEELTDVHD
jgi:hypothetical protein